MKFRFTNTENLTKADRVALQGFKWLPGQDETYRITHGRTILSLEGPSCVVIKTTRKGTYQTAQMHYASEAVAQECEVRKSTFLSPDDDE